MHCICSFRRRFIFLLIVMLFFRSLSCQRKLEGRKKDVGGNSRRSLSWILEFKKNIWINKLTIIFLEILPSIYSRWLRISLCGTRASVRGNGQSFFTLDSRLFRRRDGLVGSGAANSVSRSLRRPRSPCPWQISSKNFDKQFFTMKLYKTTA